MTCDNCGKPDCQGVPVFDERAVAKWVKDNHERFLEKGMTPTEAHTALFAITMFGTMIDELAATHPAGQMIRTLLALSATTSVMVQLKDNKNKGRKEFLEKCLKH